MDSGAIVMGCTHAIGSMVTNKQTKKKKFNLKRMRKLLINAFLFGPFFAVIPKE